MKKLIIALFAFVAMFAVAGSASAAIVDSDSDLYDANNSYTVSAVLDDTGLLKIIVERTTTAVYEVETGVKSLTGISHKLGELLWYAYIDNSDTLHIVEYRFAGEVGEVSDTSVMTNASDAVMSDGVDSTYYPVVIAHDMGDLGGSLDLIYYSAGWSNNRMAIDVMTGVYDVFLTGSDRVAHMAYQFDAGTQNGYIQAHGYNYGSLSLTYSDSIERLEATHYISGIAIAGMDESKLVAVYQTDSFYSNVFRVADYQTSVYDVDDLNLGAVDTNSYFDATIDTVTANALYIAVPAGSDSIAFNQHHHYVDTGGRIDLPILITSTNTDYINSISYAGSNNSGDPILTYSVSDTSIDDRLYKSIDGGTPGSLYQEEGEGSSIPELPGNTLWKVLIAVLALGLVVGVAAFLKKKKK